MNNVTYSLSFKHIDLRGYFNEKKYSEKNMLNQRRFYDNWLKSPRICFAFLKKFWFLNKLDGVGPVDNRPSTDKLHHFVQKKIKIK